MLIIISMHFGLIRFAGTTMLGPLNDSTEPARCEDDAMTKFESPPRPAAEGELYYIHVPNDERPVAQDVEFLSAAEFLDDEPACKALWDLMSSQFKTRSKFLSIWPSVRHVATHRRNGEVVGLLLVSSLVNWQVDYVVVRPDWRGKGIAEALVHETLNQAAARKVPYVMLTSREGLRPLYEGACGFTVVGEKPTAPAARTLCASAS
jgi:ribosomal protein S18 acetylase RimI-like enzyme